MRIDLTTFVITAALAYAAKSLIGNLPSDVNATALRVFTSSPMGGAAIGGGIGFAIGTALLFKMGKMTSGGGNPVNGNMALIALPIIWTVLGAISGAVILPAMRHIKIV